MENYSDNFSDFNYSVSEMPCKKHPNSSSVGICAYCLKERLVKLVCSDCGQRLSSCSCSDFSSSYRNSCSTMEVGSVGRISFLLENDKIENPQLANQTPNKLKSKNEQVIFLRRSSSSCVEVKKSNGFWKIKRLFRKRRSKEFENSDEKSEIWVSDVMGVSRSRSLCSFRDGASNDVDDQDRFSNAKISDVTSGIFFNEPRRSYGVVRRNVFPAKESDFSGMDESAFIDLKLGSSSESKLEWSGGRISGASDHGVCLKSESFEAGGSVTSLRNNGASCRIMVNEKGLRRSRSHKVWKWIFGYHPVSKKGGNNI